MNAERVVSISLSTGGTLDAYRFDTRVPTGTKHHPVVFIADALFNHHRSLFNGAAHHVEEALQRVLEASKNGGRGCIWIDEHTSVHPGQVCELLETGTFRQSDPALSVEF